MMYYAIPNVTDPIGYLQYVNQITGYYFGPAVVAAFFVMMFISMKMFSTEKAFAAASFLSAVFCFLMYLIGLTTISHVFVASLAVMVSVLAIRFASGSQ